MSENAVSKNHLSTKESVSCWTTKNNSSTTSHTDTYSTLHIRKPRQGFLIFSIPQSILSISKILSILCLPLQCNPEIKSRCRGKESEESKEFLHIIIIKNLRL